MRLLSARTLPAGRPFKVTRVETVRLVVEAEVVAVKMPAVRTPKFAAGPEEEPVRFPVTFPVSVPVIPPETETLEAFTFPAVMFPEASAPEKVEVAVPIT